MPCHGKKVIFHVLSRNIILEYNITLISLQSVTTCLSYPLSYNQCWRGLRSHIRVSSNISTQNSLRFPGFPGLIPVKFPEFLFHGLSSFVEIYNCAIQNLIIYHGLKQIEIYLFQMAKNDLKLSTMVEKQLKLTFLKWIKIILNYPPWLKKNWNLLFSNG